MARRLFISAQAQREISEAYTWYQQQLPGLGGRFFEALDDQFDRIAESPELFSQVDRGVRRVLVRRFPYGVFYASKGDIVSVLAVIHAARSPGRWPHR
jgi:plasmid stabilization system protein ParE